MRGEAIMLESKVIEGFTSLGNKLLSMWRSVRINSKPYRLIEFTSKIFPIKAMTNEK
jgi:hypothetical protein